MVHGLEAITLCRQDGCDRCGPTTPHDIVMRCSCRNWACGVSAHIWTATPNGDGTVALSPSVNWPGHFHSFYTRVPVLSMRALLFIEEG